MVVWVGFFVLSLTVWYQAHIDVKLWGTVITPGVVLMVGYAAISFVYAMASLVYEMADISVVTYLLLIFSSLTLIFVSLLVRYFFKFKFVMHPGKVNGVNGFIRYVAIVIAILYSIVAGYISISNGGLWSSEAKDALSFGLPAHLHVMLSFAIVAYSVYATDGNKLRKFLLCIFLISLSFYPVKGWILITLVAILFSLKFRYSSISVDGSENLALPTIALALGGTFIFFFIYLTRVDLLDFDIIILGGAMSEIFQHFIFYLTASFAGLNAVVNGLRLPGGIEVVFAPFVNIFLYLLGDEYVKVISNIYHESILGYQDGGNVFSYFGTLIGLVGVVAGIFFGILIVGLGYLFFGFAIFTKSKALFATSLYLMAVFSFGWFDYYFMLLTPYEVFAIGLCVSFFEMLLRQIKLAPVIA